jgi:hypothetical protein
LRIEDIKDSYEYPQKQCHRHEHCDATVLGSLMKALKKQDLFLFPTYPYVSLSFKSLASKLRSMPLATLCELLPSKNWPRYEYYDDDEGKHEYYYDDERRHEYGKCGVKDQIHELLDSVENTLDGIDLEAPFESKTKADEELSP